jgi:uncharacterized protein
MKPSAQLVIGLFILSFVLSFNTSAWAQDIKSRMHARLPEIVALKAQGIIGENNQGYLTVLKKPTDQQAVVDAENEDRRKIYTAIAKKQKTTAELVGQRRALQIAEKADRGTMLQNSSGEWSKK